MAAAYPTSPVIRSVPRTWRRVLNFVACGMVALGVVAPSLNVGTSSGSAFAQTPPPVPKDEKGVYRFAGVEKWRGTFSWVGSGAGDENVPNGHLTYDTSHTASGTFEMEGPTFPYENRNEAIWEGPAVGSGSINATITLTDKYCVRTERWESGGPLPGVIGEYEGSPNKPAPLRARLWIDFDKGTYGFSVSPEGLDTTSNWTEVCGKSTSSGSGSYTTQLGAGGFSNGKATATLPKDGLNIDDHITFRDQVPQMWAISDVGGEAEWTYNWGIQPAGENDVELVVDPQGFDTWLPQGGTATVSGPIGVGSAGPVAVANMAAPQPEVELSGGNVLTVTAKLQDANGGLPKQKARKMTFELLDVSREPGIAMNAPRVKMKDAPDMEFNQLDNLPLAVRTDQPTEGRKAETTKSDPMVEASAVVRSSDWGGWATLKVTAELESGEQVVGYLKGDKSQREIRLPKRNPGSKVADYWKEQTGTAGKPDSDDAEKAPEGYEGCDGDGLTLYEEYRGFFQNGSHMRTNPTRKDYFVADRIGTRYSKAGISMFKSATALETHGEMLVTDFDDNMVVNFNHAQGPHAVDQHGVQMVSRPLPDMAGGAVLKPGLKGPGTPRIYQWVVINSTLNPRASEHDAWRYATIVAHELAHTVSVAEHGSGDRQVQWMAWDDPDGVVRVHEMIPSGPGSEADPVSIIVKREDGTEIPADSPMFNGEGGLIVILGVRNGQHSGVEDCLMRYDTAMAYASTQYGEKNVRYYVSGDEQRGTMLCRTTDGTGVNASDRDPQSRYGDAGRNRGDCVHQICVNDLANPPVR